MNEKVEKCELCKKEGAYRISNKGMWRKSCYFCGYETSNTFKLNSKELLSHIKTLPELSKSLKRYGDDGYVYFPVNIITEKYMVFADSISSGYCWRFVPLIIDETTKQPRAVFESSVTYPIDNFFQIIPLLDNE